MVYKMLTAVYAQKWFSAACLIAACAINQLHVTAGENMQEINAYRGFSSHIHDASLSADAAKVIAAGADGVWIWDRYNQKVLQHLAPNGALCISMGPEGNSILIGVGHAKLQWFDQANGHLLGEVKGFDGNLSAIVTAPDNRFFLVGSEFKIEDGMVRPGSYDIQLYDSARMRKIRTFSGHLAPIRSLHILRNGDKFLSVSDDNTLRIWDMESTQELRRAGTASEPEVTEWNGKQLVKPKKLHDRANLSVSRDDRIAIWNSTLWDVHSWQEIRQLVSPGQSERVLCSNFSPDGSRFITGHADGTVRLWNVTTHSEICRVFGHENKAPILSVTFSPDGNYVLTGGEGCIPGFDALALGRKPCDLTVRLWKLPDPE